jgi:hypothetical protein
MGSREQLGIPAKNDKFNQDNGHQLWNFAGPLFRPPNQANDPCGSIP